MDLSPALKTDILGKIDKLTKEEIFKDLTGLVIALKTPSLFTDPQYMAQWKSKRIYVNQAINGLSKADYDWLDTHYRAWHDRELGNVAKEFQFLPRSPKQ